MNKIISVILVLFVLVGCSSTQSVDVVDDLTQYSRISVVELKEKLGEPVEVEDWTYETSDGSVPVTTISYTIHDNYYEFLIGDDSVVRVTLYSNQYWTNEVELFKYNAKNKSDILEMFALIPSDSTKKAVDNGFTLKYSPFNDKVANVDIQDIREKDKTFGFIKVTYDVRYFD